MGGGSVRIALGFALVGGCADDRASGAGGASGLGGNGAVGGVVGGAGTAGVPASGGDGGVGRGGGRGSAGEGGRGGEGDGGRGGEGDGGEGEGGRGGEMGRGGAGGGGASIGGGGTSSGGSGGAGGGACAPDCAGKLCGPDGCGGLCGLCAIGMACDFGSGDCEVFCGASCGGSCGACPSNGSQSLTCTASGLCKCSTTCTPDCTGKTCGDDGCGGSCGVCGVGAVCTYSPMPAEGWSCTPFAGTDPSMSFFVTSRGTGAAGGDLGGLAGADARCAQMAMEVGIFGKTWRAYLSTSAVAARDRIGAGPWRNARGIPVVPATCAQTASCVDALHQGGIPPALALTERGTSIDWTNAHDILTGTTPGGLASGADCAGWTSNSSLATATVGHIDEQAAWSSSHAAACDEVGLQCSAGQGHHYCFAL